MVPRFQAAKLRVTTKFEGDAKGEKTRLGNPPVFTYAQRNHFKQGGVVVFRQYSFDTRLLHQNPNQK
jgi:hypothetical protein